LPFGQGDVRSLWKQKNIKEHQQQSRDKRQVMSFSTYFLKIDSGNATYYVNKPFIVCIKA
jgi:hypothetical protein